MPSAMRSPPGSPPGGRLQGTRGATRKLALASDAPLFSGGGGGVIGGQAFYDSDNDGMRDAGTHGAHGVAGVDVWLYSCDPDRWLAHYRTPSNGIYRFVDLTPGDYYILSEPPAGYQFSSEGSIYDVLESTIDPEMGRTVCFRLGEGEKTMDWSFGLHERTDRPTLEPSAAARISNYLSFGLDDLANEPALEPSSVAGSPVSSPTYLPSEATSLDLPGEKTTTELGAPQYSMPQPKPHLPTREDQHSLYGNQNTAKRDSTDNSAVSDTGVNRGDPSVNVAVIICVVAAILSMIVAVATAAVLVRAYRGRRKDNFDGSGDIEAPAPTSAKHRRDSLDKTKTDSVELSYLSSSSSSSCDEDSLSKDGETIVLPSTRQSSPQSQLHLQSGSDGEGKPIPRPQRRWTLAHDGRSMLEKGDLLRGSDPSTKASAVIGGSLDEEFSRSTPDLQRRLWDVAERERRPLKLGVRTLSLASIEDLQDYASSLKDDFSRSTPELQRRLSEAAEKERRPLEPDVGTLSMTTVKNLQDYASSSKKHKCGTGNFHCERSPRPRSAPEHSGPRRACSHDEETSLSRFHSKGSLKEEFSRSTPELHRRLSDMALPPLKCRVRTLPMGSVDGLQAYAANLNKLKREAGHLYCKGSPRPSSAPEDDGQRRSCFQEEGTTRWRSHSPGDAMLDATFHPFPPLPLPVRGASSPRERDDVLRLGESLRSLPDGPLWQLRQSWEEGA